MNKVILIGNVVRDIELTTTNTGKNFCGFTLAVSQQYTKDGERGADFISIIAWNKLAENIVKFVKKGSKIGVIGKIQTRMYEDKNGEKRKIVEVIAEEVEFLSSSNKTLKEVDEETPFDDNSIPF